MLLFSKDLVSLLKQFAVASIRVPSGLQLFDYTKAIIHQSYHPLA